MNTPSPIRSLVLTAWVAAIFCLLVAGFMFRERLSLATANPLDSPQLTALREQLGHEPKNTALKEQIRRLDLAARQKLQRRQAMDKTGAYLLLVGGLGLIATARTASTLAKKPVRLPPKADPEIALRRHVTRARAGLAAMVVAIGAALAGICIAYPSRLSVKLPMLDKTSVSPPPAAEPAPSLAEFQTNWPRFRGWDGGGVCASPSGAWSNSVSGLSVAWKVSIAAPGQNSPIIWGGRIFVSGGTAEHREVFCYDSSNGALLWQRDVTNVSGSPAKTVTLPEEAGCASPTMATDGRRVYALFGNGDLAALKLDGSMAWSKYLGPIKNTYGYGASLAIWTNCLIVQLDQGDSKPAGSKLISLNCADGRTLWETSRPVIESWTTPIVALIGGDPEIITSGNPWALGYTLSNGQERWRANLLENEVVPSPIFTGDLILIPNPGGRLTALRANVAGDVTKSGASWSEDEIAPDIPSPVASGGLIFTVMGGGVTGCFQASDGKKLWEHDVDVEINASPGIIDDKLVIAGKNGTVVLLQAGREFHEIVRTHFNDGFIASPAFADGRIYLRGATNLYGLTPATSKLAEKQP